MDLFFEIDKKAHVKHRYGLEGIKEIKFIV